MGQRETAAVRDRREIIEEIDLDERGISHLRQWHKLHAIRETIRELFGSLESEPRLAHATSDGQGL